MLLLMTSRGSYRTWSPDSAHSTATGAGDIKASLQAVSAEEQARLADSLSSSRVLVGAPRSAPGSGSSSRKRKGKGKAQGSWLARLSVLVGELQGRTAYAYFCWRCGLSLGIVRGALQVVQGPMSVLHVAASGCGHHAYKC